MSVSLSNRLSALASRGVLAAPAVPALIEPARSDLVKLEDLTEGERCALIQMSGRASIQAVWFKLKEQYSVPPFTLSTFIKLRELGLASKRATERYHRLTYLGAQVAEQVANQFIRERAMHAPWLGAEDGKHIALHCVCGWSCGLIRNPRLHLRAANAFSKHLMHVENNAKAQVEGLRTALAPVCQGMEEV